MAFNIAEFKSLTSTSGYTKTSKFMARMTMPPGLHLDYLNTVRYLEYWCEAASLPGVDIAAYEGRRYGYGVTEKRPITTIFQDQAFNFIMDGEGKVFDFFTSWARLVSNFDMKEGIVGTNASQQPYELTYRSDYLVDIDIATFRDDGKESHHVVFRNAFPLMVGSVRTNWGDGNVARLPVVIAYSDWYQASEPLKYNLENGVTS